MRRGLGGRLADVLEGSGTRCRRLDHPGGAAGAEPQPQPRAERLPGEPATREDGLRWEQGRCH